MILRLCEYATANSDGTFTIIRGGIEFWSTKQLPLPVALWLMIELEPRSLPKGESSLLITGNTVAGEDVLHMDGLVNLGSPDQVTRFAIPIQFVAGSYGGITIRCRLGEHVAQLDFDVRQEKE
jgi:hypothetical protein